VRPELILCSTALRARQTLERVRPGLGEDAEVEFDPSLYAFDADALLARVRELPEAVRSVMLVGHNPAMQELVLTVASSGEGLDDVRRKFPTGAVARLDLGVGSWRELDASTARLGVFVTPRGLA
jgi:phosphohistidine phosphatase